MLTRNIPRKRSSIAARDGSKNQQDNLSLFRTTWRYLKGTSRGAVKVFLVCGFLLAPSVYSARVHAEKPDVADRLIAEANILGVQWTELSLRKALANYDRAARALLASR